MCRYALNAVFISVIYVAFFSKYKTLFTRHICYSYLIRQCTLSYSNSTCVCFISLTDYARTVCLVLCPPRIGAACVILPWASRRMSHLEDILVCAKLFWPLHARWMHQTFALVCKRLLACEGCCQEELSSSWCPLSVSTSRIRFFVTIVIEASLSHTNLLVLHRLTNYDETVCLVQCTPIFLWSRCVFLPRCADCEVVTRKQIGDVRRLFWGANNLYQDNIRHTMMIS